MSITPSSPSGGFDARSRTGAAMPAAMGINAAPGATVHASRAARIALLSYGAGSYVLFLATFLYGIGFIGDLWTPTRLDGPLTGPLPQAVLIDLLLLAAFAVQHSVMARPWFKRRITRLIPQAAERSTYVLLSSAALLALFAWWRPLGGVVWELQHPAARAAVYAVYAAGWLTVLVTTFLINHFDLFGLRQSWQFFRGRQSLPLNFATPGPYGIVRHPLYVGWLMVFWATPTMTTAHLLFAAMTTAYLLVAIRWEERDLIAMHPEYAEHRQRVPMLFPRLRRAQRS